MWFEVHAVPQLVPLQVAVVFGYVGHALHEVVPQLIGELLLEHAPAQTW
jgi:hypothetical protein